MFLRKTAYTYTHIHKVLFFSRESINKLNRFIYFFGSLCTAAHTPTPTNTLLFPNPLNELSYVICVFALNTLFSPYVFQVAQHHGVFVGVVGGALCLFLVVFILVCTDTLSQRWRTLLGLTVWATHLTMGFTFIFSTQNMEIQPWDQVTH